MTNRADITAAPKTPHAGERVAMEAALGRLAGAAARARPKTGKSAEAVRAADLARLDGVPVRLTAVLGRSRMPLGAILDLGAGSVVDLDTRVGQAIDILINDQLVARGEIVLVDDRLGVTLTEIVTSE